MPTITIDGQTCEFEGKKSIIQVANEHGVDIPQYCYHPGMSVVASCRICLAEVAQPNPRNDNKLEVIPKLVPTCQTPAVDGAEVYLKSPKTIANQKAVMEYLLINHPLDCPVCDQAGECYLQDYSYEYGRAQSRFEETKIKQPKKDLGPHVLLYADRCIMCSRCVRFTREVSETMEIGVFGRGAKEQIDIFPGKALDNELSANVVDLCPVGALLDKDFLMSMRVWNLEKTPSIDGITASGDNISIEHNEGRIYRFKPRTNLDVNKWWLTDEVRFGWKFVHREDRLTSPMKQGANNTGLEACDWSTAYRETIDRLKAIVDQHGPGSIALMASPMLASEEAYLLGKLAVALDDDALLGVGPVPFAGEDKTFADGFVMSAEKAPNARGVRRALGQVADGVLDYDDFIKKAAGKRAILLTGNYPSEWTTPQLENALATAEFGVVIDTLPSKLHRSADVVLPGATWAEKAGCFENRESRLQSFEQAIAVIEFAKPEGQIALDLLFHANLAAARRYDPAPLRHEMGDAFATDVHDPPQRDVRHSDLEYVAL